MVRRLRPLLSDVSVHRSIDSPPGRRHASATPGDRLKGSKSIVPEAESNTTPSPQWASAPVAAMYVQDRQKQCDTPKVAWGIRIGHSRRLGTIRSMERPLIPGFRPLQEWLWLLLDSEYYSIGLNIQSFPSTAHGVYNVVLDAGGIDGSQNRSSLKDRPGANV